EMENAPPRPRPRSSSPPGAQVADAEDPRDRGARRGRDTKLVLARNLKFESTPLQRRVSVSHRPGRCRSRTAAFARVCAARLASRAVETRRPEQYRLSGS